MCLCNVRICPRGFKRTSNLRLRLTFKLTSFAILRSGKGIFVIIRVYLDRSMLFYHDGKELVEISQVEVLPTVESH